MSNKVKRQDVFDLFIVATMPEHSVGKIYTMNKKRFAKFGEIRVGKPVP